MVPYHMAITILLLIASSFLSPTTVFAMSGKCRVLLSFAS